MVSKNIPTKRSDMHDGSQIWNGEGVAFGLVGTSCWLELCSSVSSVDSFVLSSRALSNAGF